MIRHGYKYDYKGRFLEMVEIEETPHEVYTEVEETYTEYETEKYTEEVVSIGDNGEEVTQEIELERRVPKEKTRKVKKFSHVEFTLELPERVTLQYPPSWEYEPYFLPSMDKWVKQKTEEEVKALREANTPKEPDLPKVPDELKHIIEEAIRKYYTPEVKLPSREIEPLPNGETMEERIAREEAELKEKTELPPQIETPLEEVPEKSARPSELLGDLAR